jgi:hypothetical protein
MYCIKCGVKLADTEKKCPLCNTVVYHPDLERPAAEPLYPENRIPPNTSGRKALCGAVIFFFMIPLIACFLADLFFGSGLNWVGYVAGALVVLYVTVALPGWFEHPNPVIFLPCDFVAAGAYLFYICHMTGGDWFWPFALPLTVGMCVILSAMVTLLYYLRKGKLYILGGGFIALGGYILLLEHLLGIAFGVRFMGWSLYPLTVLVLLGGLMIYLAINRSARELIKRKLFF